MRKELGRINYSRKFNKQLVKAPFKILGAFLARRKLFEEDPFHPKLNNHLLKGHYAGYRSINITGDWRALYTEQLSFDGRDVQKIIIFQLIGTHSQLYKR